MPLVIKSLGGRQTHTHMHTDVHTETVLKTRHMPVHAWFKYLPTEKVIPMSRIAYLYNITETGSKIGCLPGFCQNSTF